MQNRTLLLGLLRGSPCYPHLFDRHQGAGAHVLSLVAGGEGPKADLLTLQPLCPLPVWLLCFGVARKGLWGLGAKQYIKSVTVCPNVTLLPIGNFVHFNRFDLNVLTFGDFIGSIVTLGYQAILIYIYRQ